MQFGARGHDGQLALAAFGLQQHIGALGRLVLGARLLAEQRHRLARQRDEGGAARLVEDQLPAFGGLDRVARAIDAEMRNGPQRRQMLDRLMGRAVLAEADRIMGHDEDGADLHHGGEADGRAAIVGEAHEGAAIGDQAAMQRDAVHGRGHAVLAHAVMDVGAVVFAGPDLDLVLGLRVVRGRQVGRASQQFGDRGERDG